MKNLGRVKSKLKYISFENLDFLQRGITGEISEFGRLMRAKRGIIKS
jgi:hypothetical protein